jgi:hypothetical protein
MIVLLLGLGAFAGCTEKAEAQCEQFIEDWCAKAVSCDPTTNNDSCIGHYQKLLDCSKAVNPPSDFDKCPGDIQALACTKDAPAVPASCNISFRK